MASGYTTIEYGDPTDDDRLVISNCLTKTFRQEPVWDDSGADLSYWKFTIAVVGFCHNTWFNSNLFIHPVSESDNAAKAHQAQRVQMRPRQEFKMRVGVTDANPDGTVLLEARPHDNDNPRDETPAVSGVDVNNGPRCTEFSLTQVTGNDIFRVEAAFEICKVECNAQGETPNNLRGVLSHRWSSIDDVDHDFFTVRTYTGRLRMASPNFSPHSFRDLVVPPLQRGMRRARMQFVASPDGLNLDYSITDEEVAFSAPWPATSWAVKHTETSSDHDTLGVADISVFLTGDRYCNKKTLIKLALQIVEARVIGQGIIQREDKRYLLEHLSITDEIGDRGSISVSCRVRRQRDAAVGGDTVLANAQVALGQLGKPIDDAVLDEYDYRDSHWGTSADGSQTDGPVLSGPIPLIGIFRSYLQTPCNDEHGIAPESEPIATDESPGGSLQTAGDSTTTAVISDGLTAEDDPATSAAHKEAVYTFYQFESLYRTFRMRAALPIVSRVDSGSESLSTEESATTDPAQTNEATTKFVTLGRPQMRRTLRIRAERVGSPPSIPAPADYDDGTYEAVLMSESIRPGGITLSATGQRIHRVDAEYEWALSRPLRPDEQWRIGENPWDNLGLQVTDTAMFSNSEGSAVLVSSEEGQV